jgi:hypothetical protein
VDFNGTRHGHGSASLGRKATKAKTPSQEIRKGVSPNDARSTLPLHDSLTRHDDGDGKGAKKLATREDGWHQKLNGKLGTALVNGSWLAETGHETGDMFRKHD